MQANRTDDSGCVVIDFVTRARETRPSDRDAADLIIEELARVLERMLPTLSDQSADRPHFERMLAAGRRRVPA